METIVEKLNNRLFENVSDEKLKFMEGSADECIVSALARCLTSLQLEMDTHPTVNMEKSSKLEPKKTESSYTYWKNSTHEAHHRPVQKVVEPAGKKVGRQEWNKVLDRFDKASRKQEKYIQEQRLIREENKVAGLDFKPKLNKNSKRLTQDVPGLLERQEELIDEKNRDRAAAVLAKREYESSLLTVGPNLKNPCICYTSTNQHSAQCTRFVKVCHASPQNAKMRKKTSEMKRTVQDMLDYNEAKQIRNFQRAQIAYEEKQKALTFTPQTNKNSSKIYQNMVNEGRDARVLIKTKGVIAREKEMAAHFHPEILRKSRNMACRKIVDSGSPLNVYDRLDQQARTSHQQKIVREVSHMEETIQNVHGIGHEDRRCRSTPPSPPRTADITVIEYQEEHCQFILDNFIINSN